MAKRAGTVGSTVGLAGRVKGSDGSYYSVTVDLDVSAGEVLDYSCTCPAAARYPGMCKHEIALALVSLEGVPAGEGLVAVPRFACDSGRSGGADRPQSHASGGAAVERPTSEGMSVLLGRSTRQRLDEAAAARPLGASRRELARLVLYALPSGPRLWREELPAQALRRAWGGLLRGQEHRRVCPGLPRGG